MKLYTRQLFLLWLYLFVQNGNSQTLSPTISIEKNSPSEPTESFQCGTPPPDATTHKYIVKEIINKEKDRALMRNSVTNCLPIKVHIVREDAGTGGLSLNDLNIAFANLNYMYFDADLEFYICGGINYIDDSDFYDYDEQAPDNDDKTVLASGHEVTNAINVFFMNTIVKSSGSNVAGFASYPYNSVNSNRIFMKNSVATNVPNSTFAHELGHYFGVYHTHEGTEDGISDPNAEHVVRSGINANCATNGDYLCDTDADPKYSSGDFNSSTCTYTGSAVDSLGVTYLPTTAINNVMSYYPDACGGVFTAGQFTRMASALATRLTHTAYDYSCTADVVTAASGLSASISSNEIDLTWTDNAANELGYIIERSTTSSTSGFLPIVYGGVAPDITSFTDDDNITSNTTYWYRVKPVNSECNSYSNVDSITVGLMYCKPSYNYACSGSYIDDFTFDGDGGAGEISNNSGACSTDSYGDFSHLSASVSAGSTYSYEVCKALTNTRYIETWVDWNRDGDFDDTDEKTINSSNTLSPCYTGSVTVPMFAVNGTTMMRIVIRNGSMPTDPCGTNNYGEAEDYSLTILGGLPVELSKFQGIEKEKTVHLSWRTETETNNDYFTLERSKDGVRFEPIATIRGAGNTQTPKDYHFVDEFPNEGDNYYRLIQTDFDGRQEYFNTIVVSIFSKNNIPAKVLPNPTMNGNVNLLLENLVQGNIEISIIDFNGKILKQTTREAIEGNNNFKIDVASLEGGIYFMLIHGKNINHTLRFVKLNL